MKAVDLVNDVKSKSDAYSASVLAANAALAAEAASKSDEDSAVAKLAVELKTNGPIVVGTGVSLTVYQASDQTQSGFVAIVARGEDAEIVEAPPAPEPANPPVDEPIDQHPSDVATS